MIEEELQIVTDKPAEQWQPINFDITNLNIEKLARKQAFYNGVGSELSQAEPKTADLKASKQTAARFDKVGDVLPIEIDHDGDEESKGTSFKDLSAGSHWTSENAVRILKKARLIKKRKISYDKPILIVYNPNSGKKKNYVPIISARLDMAKIPYEFKPT